ncbi:MAG TPA: YfiR family protein [Verrucomicrobiae bacterium]|nr:YfiR family protein [Verrucomicrobiae bacterium]
MIAKCHPMGSAQARELVTVHPLPHTPPRAGSNPNHSRSGRVPKCNFHCFFQAGALLPVIILLSFGPLQSLGQPSREYQLKAVYLFRFAQFVEWPTNSFPTPDSPIVIAVLGPDPFNGSLEEAVRGEQVQGRALAVKYFRSPDQIGPCHVLYIGPAEDRALDDIFAHLKGTSVLTVGDTQAFARHGGIIRFVPEQGRIRFRVDLEAAKAAKLSLSSKLLRWAEIAGNPGGANR